VVLGLALGILTPIFEAPDEANHFLFVRYLQLHGSLPIQTMDQDGPRAHHPPLYFALAAALSAWVPDAGPADRVLSPINTTMNFRYGDPSVERKVKYLHSSAEAWPWQGQTLAVHVIRALSVVLSAVAVALTYAIGRLFRPHDPWLAVWAAGLLAFNPMVVFMAGVVQNSTAALAAAAAVIWLLNLWIVRGSHPALAFATGVALGLGILIQVSTLALAVPVVAVGVMEAWRMWRRAGDLQRAIRHLLVGGILVAVPAVALTGWWFWRNQVLYGDWSANQIVAALWSDQPIMPAEQTLHLMWTGMIGRFGYGYTLEYSEPIYRAAALACILGLVLSGAGAWRKRMALARSDHDHGPLLAGLHLVVIVVVAAALTYYIVGFIRGGHGRYMFTAYPSLAIVLVAGARLWIERQDLGPATPWGGWLTRFSGWLGPALVAGSLALSLYALAGLIRPAYAWPAAPTESERQIMQPLQATLTDVAEIRGVWMDPARVGPGGILNVNVVWAPLARTSSPQTVFVHLLHPAVGSIAQVDLYPGRGTLATSLWDPGREFVDRYRLLLPADAPIGEARLVLGLYDSASGARVPVTGPDAGSADDAWVWLGTVFIDR
jgi:4-amino-4-deoxy-L-arabinose transferase-like glycosyltransferase